MTPNELATFLREEVPRIDRNLPQAPPYNGMSPAEFVSTIIGLRVALDAAVRLIKRAHDDLEDADFTAGDGSCFDDLRLVVGEKETA